MSLCLSLLSLCSLSLSALSLSLALALRVEDLVPPNSFEGVNFAMYTLNCLQHIDQCLRHTLPVPLPVPFPPSLSLPPPPHSPRPSLYRFIATLFCLQLPSSPPRYNFRNSPPPVAIRDRPTSPLPLVRTRYPFLASPARYGHAREDSAEARVGFTSGVHALLVGRPPFRVSPSRWELVMRRAQVLAPRRGEIPGKSQGWKPAAGGPSTQMSPFFPLLSFC
jgi:hypothetical protein